MAIRVEVGTVAAVDEVAPGLAGSHANQIGGGALAVVHLDLPQIAAHVQPGQFLMVRCTATELAAADPLLPRAFFTFAADARAGRASLLVAQRGRGSSWLCHRKAGDRVLAFGPAGRALAAGRLTRHLLLLGEGILGVAALAHFAGACARRGLAVTLVENAAEQGGVAAHLLRADVEYRATSPEAGGLLGVLPQVLSWADEVVVAAPAGLLETLAALRRDRLPPFTLYGSVPVQALRLPDIRNDGRRVRSAPGGGDALPCGTGVCGACVVATRAGRKLFCREGPAFALEDLRFAEWGEDDT